MVQEVKLLANLKARTMRLVHDIIDKMREFVLKLQPHSAEYLNEDFGARDASPGSRSELRNLVLGKKVGAHNLSDAALR